jgi:hypothetical protein
MYFNVPIVGINTHVMADLDLSEAYLVQPSPWRSILCLCRRDWF